MTHIIRWKQRGSLVSQFLISAPNMCGAKVLWKQNVQIPLTPGYHIRGPRIFQKKMVSISFPIPSLYWCYSLVPALTTAGTLFASLGVSWQGLFYRVRESPRRPTTDWWIRPPYLYPPETGWSSYTPGHSVPIVVASCDTHGLRWGYSCSRPSNGDSLSSTFLLYGARRDPVG